MKATTNPVVKEVRVKASASRVWKAITDKNEMKKWFFDLKEFKPEPGFEFSFYGESEDKKRKYLHLCRITEVVPGKSLSYSWRYDGFEGDSLVTFELIPEGNSTLIRLTHEGLETFPGDIPDFARENFNAGWNEIIGTILKEYLEKSA